jgi:hypothetical protein
MAARIAAISSGEAADELTKTKHKLRINREINHIFFTLGIISSFV